MVQVMDAPRTPDVWNKAAYDSSGRFLGSIEAVGMGRDRIPRRVGVRAPGGNGITFFSLEGAEVLGKRVILTDREASDRSLRVVPGGAG
jgi:hypothetical protein